MLSPDLLAVCRMAADEPIPAWALLGRFSSVTRTQAELSIVCPQDLVPDTVQAERGWRAFQVAGPLDFALTGILAGLASALAAEGISLFAISTYDTDYILVKDRETGQAQAALVRAGCEVKPA